MARTFGSSLSNEVDWRVYHLHLTHSQLRFSKSCLSTSRLLSSCSRVKKLLALLLALEVCEFVTPSPNVVWSWRRRSESNRRMRLLQSPALPLGYSAFH